MTAPCLRGHTEGRLPSGKCRACQREAMRKFRAARRGTTAETVEAQRAERRAARPAPVVVEKLTEDQIEAQIDAQERAEALARIDEWLKGWLARQRRRAQEGLVYVV